MLFYFFREPSVKLNSHTYELEESGVKLKLTLCDTVGYGNFLKSTQYKKHAPNECFAVHILKFEILQMKQRTSDS